MSVLDYATGSQVSAILNETKQFKPKESRRFVSSTAPQQRARIHR